MNPEITLEFWARFFGRLALEVALVATLAAGMERLIISARWRRTIWQAALLGLVVLLAGELTGMNGLVAGWRPIPKTTAQVGASPSGLQTEALASVKILPLGLTPLIDAPPLATPSPRTAKSVTAVWWPIVIWLLGIVAALTGIAAPRILFWGLRGHRAQPVTDECLIRGVGTLARRMGIPRPVRMIKHPSLSGPVAFGWRRPTVGLPEGIDAYFTAPQQEVMMARELAHLAAHDPAWHFLADVVCALLWWHPLAWWCRGRLLSTSELAADEASRLIANGPGTLAECLVAMGRRLSQPAGFGWQRIEGNGFRSSLGQRVERLLAMPDYPWQPCGRARQWLGVLGGLITVVVLAVACMAWVAPTLLASDSATPKSLRQTWRHSLVALALTTAIIPTDSSLATKGDAPAGLGTSHDQADGQLFARIYRVDEEILVQRLQEDPGAGPAATELPQLFRNHLAQVAGLKTAPKTVAFNRGTGLLLICARTMDFVAIERALDALRGSRSGTAGPDRSAGDWSAGALDAASPEFRAPENPSPGKLFTRVFKVDPNNFLQGLKESRDIIGLHPLDEPQGPMQALFRAINSEISGLHPLDEPQGSQTTNSASTLVNVQDQVRKFFGEMGGDLHKYSPDFATAKSGNGAPGSPSTARAMFFSDRKGLIYVRATPAELDLIETGLQFLNSAPAQVRIAVKFVELSEEQAQALTGIIRPLPQPDQAGAATPSLASPHRPPIRGILTDQQFPEVMRSIVTNSGVDVVSAPQVTTLSGRQAQIAVQTMRAIVMGQASSGPVTPPKTTGGLNNGRNSAPSAAAKQEPPTTTIPTGIRLDVVPRALPDGSSIRMNLMASVTEFLGYEPVAATTAPAIDPAWPESSPQFRLQQASGTVTVWDGQTVVLEGAPEIVTLRGNATARNGLTNEIRPAFMTSPLAAYQSQSKPDPDYQKRLLVFVTPTLIDPAGNRVHADDNLTFDPKSIPSQSGTR